MVMKVLNYYRKMGRCVTIIKDVVDGKGKEYGSLFAFSVVTAILEVLGIGLVFPVIYLVIEPDKSEHIPKIVRIVLEYLGVDGNVSRIAALLVGVFLLKGIVKFFIEYRNAKISNRMRSEWMDRLFKKYMLSHISFFIGAKHGILQHNLFSLTDLAMIGLRQLVSIFMNGVSTLVVVVVLFSLSWQVTVISLAAMAITYVMVNKPLMSKAASLGAMRLDAYQLVNSLPAEAFKGIREIKTYSAENKTIGKYKDMVNRMTSLRDKINFYQLLPPAIPEVLLVMIVAGSLVVLQNNHPDKVGMMVPIMATYAFALFRLFLTGSILTQSVVVFLNQWSSIVLLRNQMVSLEYQEVKEGNKTVPGENAVLALKDVWFSHEAGKDVIRNITEDFFPGTLTAIVGDSGGGKSTLADIIIRIIEPRQGQIMYGKEDISQFSLREWRSIIAFVSQETFLFHGTIYENIIFGSGKEVTKEDVVRSAKQAYAHDFIMEKEDGYDTIVGERGAKLSGGQKQRIAIARALIREPRILILDEATSALDARSEALIKRTLTEAKREMTILLITHRLSTVIHADVIMVMKNGRIVEKGNHEALLAMKGEYYRLCKA
jgi:ABC-type multidrug transport system fused ATPase/permease subunit